MQKQSSFKSRQVKKSFHRIELTAELNQTNELLTKNLRKEALRDTVIQRKEQANLK